MFLWRPGRRLCAAALDHTSAGWFIVQVKAQTPRDGTLTLRKGSTFRGHRCFCVSAADSGHPGRRPAQPQPARDSPAAAPVLTDRAHWNRVAAVALNLSRTAQSSGSVEQPLVHASRRLGSGGEPAGNVLFTGQFGLFMHGCFSGTMQIRGASTKSRDGGETDNKEENLKADSNQPDEPGGGKPNKTQQLKKVFKEYGAVGVSFHICISLMSLGMFYLLISSGVDMAAVLCKLGFSEAIIRSKMAAGTSTFVLAYAIHKLFAPARISITLVSVPLIVRYFRKTGLFKSRTPSP